MRNFFLATLAIVTVFGQASAEARSPRLTAKQLAVNAFTHLQTAGDHQEVTLQTKQLTDQRMEINLAGTDAVLLRTQCGFAGCDSVFLVTTPFQTVGANTTTETIAAIVSANDYLQTHSLRKVLTRAELESIEQQ